MEESTGSNVRKAGSDAEPNGSDGTATARSTAHSSSTDSGPFLQLRVKEVYRGFGHIHEDDSSPLKKEVDARAEEYFNSCSNPLNKRRIIVPPIQREYFQGLEGDVYMKAVTTPRGENTEALIGTGVVDSEWQEGGCGHNVKAVFHKDTIDRRFRFSTSDVAARLAFVREQAGLEVANKLAKQEDPKASPPKAAALAPKAASDKASPAPKQS